MCIRDRYSEQEAVSISSIAQRQKISESYLEQLVAKLKKAGLVVSIRGAAGGYRLARPASGISVGDVLRALEGDCLLYTSGPESYCIVGRLGRRTPGCTGRYEL